MPNSLLAYGLCARVEGNIGSFVFLSLFALVFQAVSDYQMHLFRKNKDGQTFIKNGLWKYSRHPNDLGEILMWWGVGLSALCTLCNWYLVLGATLNHLLFLFVSIPLADGKQSKKEGYAEYEKATRKLLPIKRFK